MSSTTPLTELEAVNTLLATIGESPVATLDHPELVDVVTAKNTLDNISREVQAKGWHFNTETRLLTLSFPNNEIYIPANTLEADTTGEDHYVNVAVRGLRLYDLTNETYTFTKNLRVKLVLLFDFSELPQVARWYITVRAARVFQEKVLGSSTITQFTDRDERIAWADLRRHENKTADHNILTDSWSVARTLRR